MGAIAKPDAPRPALMLQIEKVYGTRKLVASVVLPQPNGELHSPRWSLLSDEPARELAGLRIAAYLGESDYSALSAPSRGGKVWGFTLRYDDMAIEHAEHAQAIGRVLARIANGTHKINEAEGWVGEGVNGFAAHLLRIARILRIKDMYVRNIAEAREMSGETFRKVTGGELQSWIHHVSHLAEQHRYAVIDPR